MASNQSADGPLGRLTERESEILRKAGERVFALSRRLADKEKESDQHRAESTSLRELLAESREVRKVLTDQITSLQRELDREYEERSELRRLLASLHLQMQELLPVVTGLSQAHQAQLIARPAIPEPAEQLLEDGHRQSSLAQRLIAASGIVAKPGRKKKKRRG